MGKKSKDLLVKKTEILFNKKDLLELLSSSPNSNVVVVSAKHYASDNEINISFQAQPMLLNTKTGKKIPEKGGHTILGAAPGGCPYPPGCDSSNAAQAQITSNSLGLEE